MAFTLPNFNLFANIWRYTLNPRSDPPTVLDTPANLQFGRKTNFPAGFEVSPPQPPSLYDIYNMPMWVLLPALTDVRPGWWVSGTSVNHSDFIECPSGSGRFYLVIGVDDVSKGFPTEYRVAMVIPNPPWTWPMP